MSDAIVVLAGGITAEGSLPSLVRHRVQVGARLWDAGVAERVIVSGKWTIAEPGPFPRTEAAAMAELLGQLGLPPEAILMEDHSQDTPENALLCKRRYLATAGWRQVTLVTSDFHLSRAAWYFGKVLGPGYRLEAVGAPSMLGREERARRHAKEKRLMAFAEASFGHIADGDDAAVAELLAGPERPVYHGA